MTPCTECEGNTISKDAASSCTACGDGTVANVEKTKCGKSVSRHS